MKGKKILFLFLALFSPVVVFVFLKMFGKNEFQVEVLYQKGGIEAPAHCGISYSTPYRIADSVMSGLGANNNDSLFVLYFDPSQESSMTRVSVEFKQDPLQVISVHDSSLHVDVAFVRDCILLMPRDSSVALVDNMHRIRSYYDGRDRDEVDRLIVESKIILRKY
jgi:hypothetical protein